MKSGVKGSSHLLPAHWEGGARASIEFVIAKNPVRPSKGMAEGGCGGNSAFRAEPSKKVFFSF
ncbi:MAG: hypothetical protein UY29_C0002G0056 [Parcubacteria group bacterium GW2011_GWC2_48_17]|nr:MAG: hypothetical protein UY29_C0002G0056 [Parcubacteria group bacterium GW2011_GWC2_48_17]